MGIYSSIYHTCVEQFFCCRDELQGHHMYVQVTQAQAGGLVGVRGLHCGIVPCTLLGTDHTINVKDTYYTVHPPPIVV